MRMSIPWKQFRERDLVRNPPGTKGEWASEPPGEQEQKVTRAGLVAVIRTAPGLTGAE